MSQHEKPLQVLHVVQSLDEDYGGPARSVTSTALHLQEYGVHSQILFCDSSKPKVGQGSEFARYCYRPLRDFRALTAPSLQAFQQPSMECSSTLIHVHGIWTPLCHQACRVAQQTNLPYGIAPRGMLEPWSMSQKKWKKRLAMWLYQRRDLQRARFIHATSTMEADAIDRMGFSRACPVIPNGTEFPDPMQPRTERATKTALFLSRIHPKKGLENLVRAWSEIRPPDWICRVVGPDPDGHWKSIEDLIRALKLESSFEYLPPVDGPAKWSMFAEADLFVLPSFSENFGLAIAEALACSLPVVTTKGTPWREIEEHRCGWWIEPNLSALEAALRSAFQTSHSQRLEMGARGRRLAEDRYSWKAVAQALATLYRSVVDDRRIAHSSSC